MIPRDLLGDNDYVCVRAALVRALDGDATAAIVLSRIYWRSTGPQGAEGWWRGSSEVIADETGLTADQVRKALTRLKTAGHLVTSKRREAGSWDQTLSYRVVTENGQMHLAPGPNEHSAPEPDVPLETPKTSVLPNGKTQTKAERKEKTPLERTAHNLTVKVFERADKPRNFPGVYSIFKRALERGVAVGQLEAVVTSVGRVSWTETGVAAAIVAMTQHPSLAPPPGKPWAAAAEYESPAERVLRTKTPEEMTPAELTTALEVLTGAEANEVAERWMAAHG